MKVEAVHQFTSRDPVDISELISGEAARKQKRLSLMRQFLWWAYTKEHKRWTESNNEERIIVHRHFNHGRMMVGFSGLTTFLVYNAFFRGIYTFRARELVNMRQVPFALKFGISASLGLYLSYDQHLQSIYEPDLYKVALKYRTYYDSDYQASLDDASERVDVPEEAGKLQSTT